MARLMRLWARRGDSVQEHIVATRNVRALMCSASVLTSDRRRGRCREDGILEARTSLRVGYTFPSYLQYYVILIFILMVDIDGHTIAVISGLPSLAHLKVSAEGWITFVL